MPASSADNSSQAPGTPGMTPASLNIIRFALLGGSLLIGAVAWFLIKSGQIVPTVDEELTGILRLVFYASLVLTMGAIWVIRQRAGQAEGFTQRGKLLLIGYAVSEWLTLFGAVYLFLSGNASLFLGGLLVLVIAFALLPISKDS